MKITMIWMCTKKNKVISFDITDAHEFRIPVVGEEVIYQSYVGKVQFVSWRFIRIGKKWNNEVVLSLEPDYGIRMPRVFGSVVVK